MHQNLTQSDSLETWYRTVTKTCI